jgi:uncharacterized membrane protein HdeD (DUF308 family)
MGLGIVIGVLQIAFAFLCVWEVKRQGRLNNWWVLAAALFGVGAYLVAVLTHPRPAQ